MVVAMVEWRAVGGGVPIGQEEPKVDVHDVPVRVQQDVPVVPIFDLREHTRGAMVRAAVAASPLCGALACSR